VSPLRWLALALCIAAALALPQLVRSAYALNFLILVLFSAYLGQAWNVLGGFAGQSSFGHVVFFGTGAYTSSILQMRYGVNPWLGMAAAGLAGALVGGAIGFLSFRFGLRGSYFALITLAFAEAFRIVANSVPITGAGLGILIPLRPSAANFQFADKDGFYYVILMLLLGALAIAGWLKRSRFGARLAAVRENEDAAAALGVDGFRCKLGAIALSGGLTAVGGTFYAQYFLYIDPSIAYGVGRSVEILLVAIVGGVGTVFGPLLGALALQTIGELTRAYLNAPALSLVVYGALLIAIVGFLPDGLVGLTRLGRRRRRGADA
jgi:branched-chain amino acid transport system permease protein